MADQSLNASAASSDSRLQARSGAGGTEFTSKLPHDVASNMLVKASNDLRMMPLIECDHVQDGYIFGTMNIMGLHMQMKVAVSAFELEVASEHVESLAMHYGNKPHPSPGGSSEAPARVVHSSRSRSRSPPPVLCLSD